VSKSERGCRIEFSSRGGSREIQSERDVEGSRRSRIRRLQAAGAEDWEIAGFERKQDHVDWKIRCTVVRRK
jgi:hypothetical protein